MALAGPPSALGDTVTRSLLFQQTFHDNVLSGTGEVVKPAATSNNGSSAPNVACLTATGSPAGPVLQSCPQNSSSAPWKNDPDGSGVLSFTPRQTNKVGGVFAATSVPTSQGLDVKFTMHQYSTGNSDPADGLAFALSAVDPTSPTAPPNIGPMGGSLAYSNGLHGPGLAHAYLGLGFDVYGNYSNSNYQGTDCGSSSLVANATQVRGQLLVRGPGNGTHGYCALNGTATTPLSSAPVVPMHASTRAASAIPVRVVINPASTPAATADGVAVNPDSYLVNFTPIGQAARTLTGPLPAMNASFVDSPSWLDSDGLPKQLAFGWVGSTGSAVDNHEIDDVTVTTLNAPVPLLNVSQTSYTPGAQVSPGQPVGYVVTPGVSPGASEPGPVSVTLTAPSGVAPLGGSGPNWSCAAPVGQKITCTNSSGPFAANQTLPPISITAVATGSVSAETVQTATVTTASSDTGQAAYSTSAPAGTNPPAPVVTAIGPNAGLAAGGNQVTITGSNLVGTTAIWVGTQAEIDSGSAAVLVPCSATVTVKCFTTNADGQLVVTRWPGHATGPVVVQVVALGTAGTVGYTYVEFTSGSLLITELRSSGPAGDGDSYVELTNNTAGPLPLAGVFLQSGDGDRLDLPSSAQPLPAGGSYLIGGPAYSLESVAHADQRADKNDFAVGGVRVLAPNGDVYVVSDTVGPAGSVFHKGQGLPAFTGNPTDQYGWVRTQQTGAFKNTGDNAADFALVSTTGGVVGGVQSMLGSPSPTGLTSPWNRSATITSTLLDPGKSANEVPNRVVTKTQGRPGGRIESRRVVTNTTGQTVRTLQLRLIDITEVNGLTPLSSVIPPGSPVALLRAVQPATPSVTVNGRTVSNLTPADPTVVANGGGLNSTFIVPLPEGGLAPHQSATVALTFDASTAGKFFFRYSTEAVLGNPSD